MQQQVGVDGASVKDIIDVGAFAVQLIGKPFDGMRFGLRFKHLFYPLTDMKHPGCSRSPVPSGFLIEYKLEKRGTLYAYLITGIAKHLLEINSPLPRLTDISTSPCRGVDITRQSRSAFDCSGLREL